VGASFNVFSELLDFFGQSGVQLHALGGVQIFQCLHLRLQAQIEFIAQLSRGVAQASLCSAVEFREAEAGGKAKYGCEDKAHDSQRPQLSAEDLFVVGLVLLLDAGDVVLLQGGAGGGFFSGVCPGLKLFDSLLGLGRGQSGGRRGLRRRLSRGSQREKSESDD